MSIIELFRRIPPPECPNEAVGDWNAAVNVLGSPLPDDYRQFVHAYGTGYLARFYTVFNPFSSHRYINLLMVLDRLRSSEAQSTFFPDAGYSFFPNAGGLIPWMGDDNGNNYFWRTGGEPNSWPVVQCEYRGDGFAEFPMTMTAFLLAIFDRTIPALAGNFPAAADEFFEPVNV